MIFCVKNGISISSKAKHIMKKARLEMTGGATFPWFCIFSKRRNSDHLLIVTGHKNYSLTHE